MELSEWLGRRPNGGKLADVQAFAASVGAHWVTVYAWMAGRRMPHARFIVRIIRATRGQVRETDLMATWRRAHRAEPRVTHATAIARATAQSSGRSLSPAEVKRLVRSATRGASCSMCGQVR